MIDRQASHQRRVTTAKIVLLAVALFASYVTSLRPGNILFLVGAAFSLAASSFFPVLVLAIFCAPDHGGRGGGGHGHRPGRGGVLHLRQLPVLHEDDRDFRQPLVRRGPDRLRAFGVPAGFAVAILVSLVTPRNAPVIDRLVNYLRKG